MKLFERILLLHILRAEPQWRDWGPSLIVYKKKWFFFK